MSCPCGPRPAWQGGPRALAPGYRARPRLVVTPVLCGGSAVPHTRWLPRGPGAQAHLSPSVPTFCPQGCGTSSHGMLHGRTAGRREGQTDDRRRRHLALMAKLFPRPFLKPWLPLPRLSAGQTPGRVPRRADGIRLPEAVELRAGAAESQPSAGPSSQAQRGVGAEPQLCRGYIAAPHSWDRTALRTHRQTPSSPSGCRSGGPSSGSGRGCRTGRWCLGSGRRQAYPA